MSRNSSDSLKKKIGRVRLSLPANKAAPSPILGQAFGQFGINMMEVCKTFNRQTQNLKDGLIIPTAVTVYNNNTFDLIIKTPSTTAFFKNTALFVKGSSLPKKQNLIPN